MAENFDKLRGQRKFARQSFWSRLGLNFSSNKEDGSKTKRITRDSSNAERKARMKEMRKEEIEILETELRRETAKSKGVPSVKMMNLNRQIQVLKAYNEAVDGFGEKYKTLGDAKRAVKERRNQERELYLKNEVFEEKYKFFLRIQDLQKALRDFEETAGRVFLDFRYNGNSESEKFYEELRVEIGKIETELQTLEMDNPIEFRSAYLLSLQEDLKKEGHIAQVESVQEYLEQIKIRMTIGKPMFLHGPTGTGKTSLARFASKELTGKNPEIVYCNPQTRESNIYGRTGISVEDGASKTFFDFGPLARAMQNGSVCIFDEFTAPRTKEITHLLVFLGQIFINICSGDLSGGDSPKHSNKKR
jgi:ATP-dependent Clp protease ATP-binding subunit ClpA